MHDRHIPVSKMFQDLLIDQSRKHHLRRGKRHSGNDQHCVEQNRQQRCDPHAAITCYLSGCSQTCHKHYDRCKYSCQDTGYDRNDQVPDPRIFDLFVFQFDRSGEFALEIIPRVRDKRQPRVFFSHPFSDRIQSDRMEDVAYQCQDQHQRKDDQIN